MTKVLLVAPHYPEYTLALARALAAMAEVTAVVDSGQVESEFAGRSVPQHDRLDVVRIGFRTPADLLRLIAAARRARPSIIHIQEPVGPRRGFMAAALAVLAGRSAPIALTVHDPVPHPGADTAAARRSAMFQAYLRRRADLVFVHGDHCRRLYLATRPPPGQTVLATEHGVILVPEQNAGPAEQRSSLRLLMFGRMEAYKGLGTLAAAFRSIAGRDPPTELLVAGSGVELDRLEPQLRSLPGVEVRNGFVPPVDALAALQACDAVVLPYLSATQSGIVAAAFANGRPVIASDTGGLRDVVRDGENGLLVPPGDADALAAAIRRLAGDAGLRAKLAAGARETAREQLDWNRIAGAVHAAYRSILDGDRRRALQHRRM